MTAWASLPIAILPCGISTAQVIPARAAYAAAEAEVDVDDRRVGPGELQEEVLAVVTT